MISIYYSFKDVDFAKLGNILQKVNYLWVVITVPIVLISHWVRAIRWKTMLAPIKQVDSIKNLFSAVMIGYFFNNIIPRGGEFVRPFVFSRKEKVSFSSLFATILFERILDVLFLVLIFATVFIFSKDILNILPKEINPNYIYIIIVLLLTVILSTFFPPIVYFFLNFIKKFSEKLYLRAIDIFEKVRKGFSIVKSPSQYLKLSLESLSIWLLYALPLYCVFFAFPFQEQFHLGIIDAIMLVIVAGVGVTIAPTPGAVGVYHGLITTAMIQLYGIEREEALAYAIVTHFVSRTVEIATGYIFFLLEQKDGSSLSFNLSSLKSEEIAQ